MCLPQNLRSAENRVSDEEAALDYANAHGTPDEIREAEKAYQAAVRHRDEVASRIFEE